MLKNRINIAVAGATGYVGFGSCLFANKTSKSKNYQFMCEKNIGKISVF